MCSAAVLSQSVLFLLLKLADPDTLYPLSSLTSYPIWGCQVAFFFENIYSEVVSLRYFLSRAWQFSFLLSSHIATDNGRCCRVILTSVSSVLTAIYDFWRQCNVRLWLQPQNVPKKPMAHEELCQLNKSGDDRWRGSSTCQKRWQIDRQTKVQTALALFRVI